MKPEQQRIAIAEACGWTQPEQGYWKDPDGHEWQVMHGWQTYKDGTDILPDYLSDLNAMHEAEKVLNKTLRLFYQSRLMKLQKADLVAGFWFLIHATAAQRAEAFLRTLNLWKDLYER